MPAPSKLGPLVLSLFGLPFLGVGLFAAYTFLQDAQQPLATRIGAAAFASVFAVIGGGLIFGSCYGYSLQKKQAAREQAQPGSPWLWREDWAAGRAKSNKASVTGWWVGAALANLLCLPFALGAMAQGWETRDPKYLFPAGLALLGLLVLAGAIRATMRLKRYGKTYFDLASLPFSPGGRVAGAIHLHLDDNVARGVDLKLSCFRRVVSGTGKNRSSQQMPLWEASKNVPAAAFARGPFDTSVPVEFHLPADAYQTDHEDSNDQVFWLLRAGADVPGVDYRDEFELPVFRASASASATTATAATDSLASGAFAGAGFASAAASLQGFAESSSTLAELSEEVAEPARHRAVVQDSPDGLQFYFRAARNTGRTLLVVILAAAVSALFYAMVQYQPRAPFFAFAVVGLLDFFLILAVMHTALMSTRITAGNGRISWRRSILGMGRTHELPISEVDSILPVTSIQQASSSGNTQYSLRLTSKAGKTFTLADEIESRDESRWIVAQIEKRAGLRLSTQVAINDSLHGPPPQPGSLSAARGGAWSAVTGPRLTFRVGGKWSPAVGAIFFLISLSFIAFTMFRASHSRTPITRRPTPKLVAKPSAPAGPHPPSAADPNFGGKTVKGRDRPDPR